MEKDTVIITVEKYNELRDFQKEVKSGKIFSFSRYFFSSIETNYFFTESQMVEKFETRIKELEIINKELQTKIEIFWEKEQKISLNNSLKKMSYWQFRKWRKS